MVQGAVLFNSRLPGLCCIRYMSMPFIRMLLLLHFLHDGLMERCEQGVCACQGNEDPMHGHASGKHAGMQAPLTCALPLGTRGHHLHHCMAFYLM